MPKDLGRASEPQKTFLFSNLGMKGCVACEFKGFRAGRHDCCEGQKIRIDGSVGTLKETGLAHSISGG